MALYHDLFLRYGGTCCGTDDCPWDDWCRRRFGRALRLLCYVQRKRMAERGGE